MIVAETALGRMTRKSPVGAFAAVRKGRRSFGGWINAIIPILIVPYYSVIGGWVIRYLADYVSGHGSELATDGYFSAFISSGASAEICFVIFTIFTLAIIFAGVRNGVERVSKVMMPILVVLSVIIAGYSVTRPGALEGVKYFLVPNLSNFSWMTVVTAMGQMFYSLSIAMGILVTFGSYMKKDVSIEESTENVEIFDTAIAIMAGLMIIPAVFSFSGGDPALKQAVEELGRWIGESGNALVYGGSRSGLMGRLAHSVLTAGGEVTGVEPQFFIDSEVQYDGLTRLIVTQDMTERKTRMIELGDAFIAFPGGTGTLEEIAEVMSKVSLGHLDAPCILYDLDGYYAGLKALLAHMVEMGLSSPERQSGIYFAKELDEIKSILKRA